MKYLTVLLSLLLFIGSTATAEVQNMNVKETLSAKQRGIVPIAAFAATGDMERLKTVLNEGLDAGLTINEIKEVLVQMCAYAGFPRSLNGISAFMGILEERQRKGIKDQPGKEASPLPSDKSSVERGTEIQTRLVGTPVVGPIYAFAPAIDKFLKGHLFGDIFGRDNLDFQSREIATISALASIEVLTPQLQSHFSVAFNIGLTEGQMRDLISLLAIKVGKKEGDSADSVLNKVLSRPHAKGENPVNDVSQSVIFPKGEKLPSQFSKYFVGTAYLSMLVPGDKEYNCPIGNVTFEPGARNNWHKHPGGQILLVTGGRGYYQESGKPARELHPGDVVKIAPNTKHWHGAAPDSWFVHLSIETNVQAGPPEWLEPVSGEEYGKLR
jgi:4-carboxymuconolactone decarboxylase